jgi:hypothetical protein
LGNRGRSLPAFIAEYFNRRDEHGRVVQGADHNERLAWSSVSFDNHTRSAVWAEFPMDGPTGAARHVKEL